MKDKKTTVEELKNKMAQFVRERDWEQFHSPKNLSMSIMIEAAELMEKFQWVGLQDSRKEIEKDREEIEHELIDILSYILSFAHFYDIDMSAVFARKMAILQKRYPVEKVKGRYDVKKIVKVD